MIGSGRACPGRRAAATGGEKFGLYRFVPSGLSGFQHFSGMGQWGGCTGLAAQHAGQFGSTAGIVERFGMTDCGVVLGIDGLGYTQVVMGRSCYLWQVSDGQYLAILSQLAHHAAHGVGHDATHARVDLVKDQGGCLSQLAGSDGNGQRDAGEFAARGHLGNGARTAAAVS